MANWDLALGQQTFVGGMQEEFGQRVNDALGEVTHYTEWNATRTQKTQDATRAWDRDGQLQREGDALDGSTTLYTRMNDGTLTKTFRSIQTDPTATTVTTTYKYAWLDVAKLRRVTTQASNPHTELKRPTNTYNYLTPSLPRPSPPTTFPRKI